mgnify:CR=1 FL=1
MLVTMTDKDLYRLGIIQRVHDHTLLQREAARLLELTVRQVQRILRRYREHGAASIVSERRGRPGNNIILDDLRCAALYLIRQPCLVSGSLAEVLPD